MRMEGLEGREGTGGALRWGMACLFAWEVVGGNHETDMLAQMVQALGGSYERRVLKPQTAI